MEDGYTVYDDNNDDDTKWYMMCVSLLTPIIIISIIYFIRTKNIFSFGTPKSK